MTEPGKISEASARIIASVMADTVRHRLIAYTPVKSADQALVLAYTAQIHDALLDFVYAYDVGGSFEKVAKAVSDAIAAADAAGFKVPSL